MKQEDMVEMEERKVMSAYNANRPIQSRSRSPDRERYRSRSPRGDREYRSARRERSPTNGYDSYSQDRARAPPAAREDRKEQMMSNVKENSRQECRVYVGNLSYDVKWHHLKDFMRTGKSRPSTLQMLKRADHVTSQLELPNSPKFSTSRTE